MATNFENALLGVKINFQRGVQVTFPAGERTFHLRVTAQNNQIVVFDQDISSLKQRNIKFYTQQTYYIPWLVEIFQKGQLVFRHQLNMTGQPVALEFLSQDLSDIIAWLPAALELQRYRNVNLTLVIPEQFIDLFAPAYPEIKFIAPPQFQPEQYYAIYPVGNFPDGDRDHNPSDGSTDNKIEHAAHILGVKLSNELPEVATPKTDCRKKYGRYVIWSTFPSRERKPLLPTQEQNQVIKFLQGQGLKVLALNPNSADLPSGVEDFSAISSWTERLDLIHGCEFLLGDSTPEAWLAKCCNKSVAVFSQPTNIAREFDTAWRLMPLPEEIAATATAKLTAQRVIAILKTLPEIADVPEHRNRILESGILISVLVPVYNAQDKLRRCIDSILRQSYPNFELILSDDQSTDASLNLIREYEKKDSRVKVIANPQNRGTLCNRKTLVKAAQGEYCCWVDNDDEISSDFLAKGISVLIDDRYDILEFPFEIFENPQKIKLSRMIDFEVKSEHLGEFFLSGLRTYPYYLWNKIIRTEVLKKSLPPDLNYNLDDVFFAFPLFYNARSYRAVTSATPVYRYYFGNGQWSDLSRQNNLDFFEKCCKMRVAQVKLNVDFMRKHHFTERQIKVFVTQFCNLPELVVRLNTLPQKLQLDAYKIILKYFGKDQHLVNDYELPIGANFLFDELKQFAGTE